MSTSIVAENVPYEEYLSERYGRHVEWVDGVVIAMPQPTVREVQLRWFIRLVFDSYLESNGGGETFCDPFTMKTGSDLPARQPDVYVILPERLPLLRERELAGAANLVVEIITQGYETRDKVEKFDEYQKGGVQEYWILDPERKEPLFYVLGEDGLFHSHLPVEGVYTSAVLPKLKLCVDLLWQEKLPSMREVVQMVEEMLKERVTDGVMETKNSVEQFDTDNIRSGYDEVAEEYAERVYGELAHKPLDRELLDRFASRVMGKGLVCDLGCGPGHVARYLHEHGVASAFGLDLSPKMLDVARRLNLQIEFKQGDMRALPLDDETLAGIAAFYSLIHIPRQDVTAVARELLRVLKPGGVLLVAVHRGDDDLHTEELWGKRVSLDCAFFLPDELEGYLRAAGFNVEETIERDPYPDVEYASQRIYVFASKP